MRCQINRKTLPLAEGVDIAFWSFCSSRTLTVFCNIAVVLQVLVAIVAAIVAAVVAAVVAVVVAAFAQNPYCLNLLIWEWTPVHSAKLHRQIVDTTAGRKYNF